MKIVEITDKAVVSLTVDELGMLASCIKEALTALEDWEYPIRVGAEKWEARVLLGEINNVMTEMRGDSN